MAYVDGPSLAKKVKERPLPLDEALDIACQIGEGLLEAHEKGIVHRDIKPQNIMLTAKGQVKIMDFGLASLAGRSKLTKSGTTLGTPAYMAPEQLEGKQADRRADIWALGCVCYEMLTQHTPFEAEYEQAIAYGILNEDPEPVTARRSGLPPALDRVLDKALAKEPEERYQHVDEMLVDLRRLDKGAAQPKPSPKPVEAKRFVPWAIAAACAALACWSFFNRAPSTPGVQRLIIPLPEGHELRSQLDISPDGTTLAYLARGPEGPPRLYLRPIDAFEAVTVPSSENSGAVFFSPDGQWVGFQARGAVWKASVLGGSPQKMFELDGPLMEAHWRDDEILYKLGFVGDLSISRTSLGGGAPEILMNAEPDLGEGYPGAPRRLPGGKELFVAIRTYEGDGVVFSAVTLEGGERRTLHRAVDGRNATLLERGFLIFGELDGLMAARFDFSKGRLVGSPLPALDGLLRAGGYFGNGNFAVSESGTLAYISGELSGDRLVWVDREGAVQPLIDDRAEYGWIDISPNGRRAAVQISSAHDRDIWVYDLETTRRTRLTHEAVHRSPVWSWDSRRVAFQSNYPERIEQRISDASRPVEVLLESDARVFPRSWSPDGENLLYQKRSPDTENDTWVLPLGGEPRPLLDSAQNEIQAQISPNGRWLAFVTDESDDSAVYVQRFPEGGGRQPVSFGGGERPRWSGDGRELFYLDGSKMMAATIDPGPPLKVGTPRELFDNPLLSQYDVDPSGRRFLMIERGETSPANKIHVIVNWVEELDQLLPD